MDLNHPEGGNTSPSLSLGGFRGQRYPNQFFDLSQQYMPPTIKELFRWCTFYYYNNPLVGAAITKISRYPITDLIFEDSSDHVRDLWSNVFNNCLKIKEKAMEFNLDYHAYGNCFVSMHLPFTRFLICSNCKDRVPLSQADWRFNSGEFSFSMVCQKCGHSGAADVKDIPYKDLKGVRLIRWNPENINLKFNEYTGRYIYMYSVPQKLKNAILRGDRDILQDTPIIVLQALKTRRMIRFNNDNIYHFKRPTLAEQDQGWGKPTIIHVLKDLYYYYTLRRSQEAIALEHIVPFDIIYPMPNSQQDPYIHTDLGSWKVKIEEIIARHRRDPNFKAVIPIPVGFGRIGGDGKALLLAPEISHLTQTIVGGMGIAQEFIFGGLNWTGSSVSLRTLENDFIQNRAQLIDFIYWAKEKVKVWMDYPDIKTIRYADFRMADDIQKHQQLIGLNAQMKVSDQTLLTELGYDYDQEVKKMIEEAYLHNYLNDVRAKGAAKSQGEAGLINFNYQSKIQELARKAEASAQAKMQESLPDPAVLPQQDGYAPMGEDGAGSNRPQQSESGSGRDTEGYEAQTPASQQAKIQIERTIKTRARRLTQMEPSEARQTLQEIRARLPELGSAIEQEYNRIQSEEGAPGSAQQAQMMKPMPEKKPPRRQGGV